MFWIIGAILLFSGCIQSNNGDKTKELRSETGIYINFHQYILKKASSESPFQISDAVNIRIIVTTEENEEQYFESSFSGESMEISNLKPGPNQTIQAELMDESGEIIFTAVENSITINAGEIIDVTLRCKANFSSINSTMSFGMGNPYQISAGNIVLANSEAEYDSTINISGDFGKISIPKIKGDLYYQIEVNLSDSLGNIIFNYSSPDSIFIPMGEIFYLNIPLNYQMAESGIRFEINESAPIELSFAFPQSTLRLPVEGEIRFTHFFPNPPASMGGNAAESFSIFNLSTDSLMLDSCKVARTRGSNSATTSYHFEPGTFIQPGKNLVLGGSAADNVDLEIEMQMVSTKQSLILLCEYQAEEFLIDSLSYTSEYNPQDSVYSENEFISAKYFEKIGDNNVSENWCLADPLGFNPKNPSEFCLISEN